MTTATAPMGRGWVTPNYYISPLITDEEWDMAVSAFRKLATEQFMNRVKEEIEKQLVDARKTATKVEE